MVKTRVHDLAAEFGIAPERLLGMLKDMNIFVRSHLSALESDQVSAVRVRWEREKRKSAEEPTGPLPTPRMQEKYFQQVLPALAEKFNRANRMALPRLQKIVVNMGAKSRSSPSPARPFRPSSSAKECRSAAR